MTTGFCNKCGFSGQVGEFGQHLRPSDGGACSYMAGSPLVKPHPAPSPSEVGPEVVDRMIALVRAMVKRTQRGGHYATGPLPDDYNEAVEIGALLPEPVDADEAEVQFILHRWEENELETTEDAVREALKRGRALEKEAGR